MNDSAAPALTARLVRVKTFVTAGPDLPTAVATVETAINAWLADANERRIVALEWGIDGVNATAAVWYVE